MMIITPQIAVIISFAAGAAIFFGIGFYIARVAARRGKDQGAAGPAPAPDQSRGAGEPAAEVEQPEAISRQRDEAVKNYLTLRSYVVAQKEKTRAYFDAVKTRFAEIREELAAADDNAVTLKEEALRLTRELEQSDSEKEAALREKEHFSQALERQERRLKEESERRLEALSRLEDENQSLMKRVMQAEGQLKDFDDLRNENHWLKSELAETEARKDEIDELKRENARLNAMGMILEKPLSHSVPSSHDGLGGSFQNVANQLSQMEGSRGVVLADDIGLAIAGTGDHMEAMAGMAAVFSDVCIKMDSLLPFGEIDAMKITNRQNLTIAMQPFDIASVNVIITTLSVGPEPNRETIDKLIEQMSVS
jgi:hypothetical protein